MDTPRDCLPAHVRRWVRAGLLCVAAAGAAPSPALGAEPAAALAARYAALSGALAASPLGRPVVLDSRAGSDRHESDVVARVDAGFPAVVAALDGPRAWCDLLILNLSIKRCEPQGPAALRVRLGRRWDQPADEAFALTFQYRRVALVPEPGYLEVVLEASDGPMGTRDYRIEVEAVPLDAGHAALHLRYGYGLGLAARLAIQAYVSTIGRAKVGFTVVGTDAQGRPVYVDGARGLVERTTLRYWLAIDAAIGAVAAPPAERAERRMQAWFDATEQYPRQLHEIDRATYLAMTRAEIASGAPTH